VNGIAWPDLIIGAILIFGALKGYKRGFIAELTGAVALVIAIVAAFQYPGTWDETVKTTTGLHPDSAHVVAMVLYSAAAYAIVLAVGALLSRIAKLPIIGFGNALLGALLGLAKAAAFMWAVVYVALFFPLSRDLRHDLHQSRLIALLEEPNPPIDGALRNSLPWFMRPFAEGMFARHRV
jgi:uncharacterized membrane protein required for colicin V production